MPKLRVFFEEICEFLFQFNIMLIPFAFLLGAVNQSLVEALKLLLLLPLVLYHYALRHTVKRLRVFLVLTWLSCAVGVLSPHPVFYTLFAALLCMASVKRRTTDGGNLHISFELLCFPLALLAAMYIGSGYLNADFMRPFFHGQAIAIFLLALIYVHLSGVNAELELASASSLQSTEYITSFTNACLAVYLVGFLAVLALFRYVPFGRLFLMAGMLVIRLLRFLFSLVGSESDSAVATPLTGAEQELLDLSMEEQPLWLEIIERILIYTVNIFVLLAIIFFAVLFFLQMYRGFHRHRGRQLAYSDEVSQLSVTKADKRRSLRKARLKSAIRRRYYRCVNKYFKKGRFNAADTPKEIKAKLNELELDELTAAYERERYGKA